MMRRRLMFYIGIIFIGISLFLLCCKTLPLKTTGAVDAQKIGDGIYKGRYAKGILKAVVRVTIHNHRMTDIEILSHRAGRGYDVGPVIVNRILDRQSTRVDAVSGATSSSHVIMNAVQDALDKAGEQSSEQ